MATTTRFKTSRCCPNNGNSIEATLRPRRPRTSVFSILIPNSINEDNNWVQVQITRGSWVLMQPRRRKQSTSKNIFRSAWKGRVKDFKIHVGKTTVKEVLVQHVYMHNELVLDRDDAMGLPTHRPNYAYPSSYEEWEPVECILGIFNVVHGHIGQLQYEGRSGQILANAGIYFYDHFYHLCDSSHSSGTLEKLPLQADWNYLDWPIPDSSVIESTKSKAYKDVQRSLRGSIATKIVKIVMYMPITVFVDLFSAVEVKIAKTMLICKSMDPDVSSKLLDAGWHNKEIDNIHCEIVLETLVAKYMIATQTFIMSFWYKRSRFIGGLLVPMDQEAASLVDNKVIDIEVLDEASNLTTVISIRENCNLVQLRKDIIEESLLEIPRQFLFIHNGRKLMRRRERLILCKDLNNKVQFISD